MLRFVQKHPRSLSLLVHHDDDTGRGDAPYDKGAEDALAAARRARLHGRQREGRLVDRLPAARRQDGGMPDYGQDLQFGTFLTPDAARADRVVELALLTEAAGLELATIQDHPYQQRFLDAWALIAHDPGPLVVAARHDQRQQPAAAPAVRAREDRGQPRRAQPRPGRARHRRRRVLGRHRRRRRPASYAGGGAGRARRGHRGDQGDLAVRPGAAARRRDLDRRDRPEDAGADRPGRRRLAAQPVLRAAGAAGRAQRAHRRRGARRRAGPVGGAPALQREPVRRPGLGRVAGRADARPTA